ncbi:MAG TPA: M28 family metallopeptidase [Vicinamibacterales bacterium]|nr:M28 family metallopeptidase [Vicinamibacterales bacterium]
MRTPAAAVLVAAAAASVSGVAALAQRTSASVPFGFTAAGAAVQETLERRFLALPDRSRLEAAHAIYAAEPHIAGSPRDRALAEWTARAFTEAGLTDVTIATHEVLLPWPLETSVEMVAPRSWRASMREDPVAGDRYTEAPEATLGLPYHAYSASGDITAEVVYAGSGSPADYDWLASRGVDVRGRIVLVRYSVPYSYRGFKALTAQQRGAAGILIYSDPADDGAGKGTVYPDGPWGPLSHIQRGGIVYDFIVPGDPLTPGWASVAGARRIDRPDAASLPKIVSAPLSARDARPILEALGGTAAPDRWQGGLPLKYRVGPGPAKVRMRVQSDDGVRPIWTVTAMIRGSERPGELVILGNHRDAWIYGGVDPSSGSAALVELARAMGTLVREGWRPRRSIVLASWDAEEFTLTSSTEWGEEHRRTLMDGAVAYINVDSAASGPHLAAAAVPSLNRLIAECAQIVRDPRLKIPLAAAARERRVRERGALPTGAGDALVNNRLGSGSDYTVFLNHLGVPVADLSFDGPYGVYHSMYDNHNWVARIGDPGFAYHEALVRLWGLVALRLASAETLPLDTPAYAARLADFLADLQRQHAGPIAKSPDVRRALGDLRAAVTALTRAAEGVEARRKTVLANGDDATRDRINRQLLRFERAFLSDEGIPGRPWYRHLVYAPKYTYAPEIFPGVAEALEAGDGKRAAVEAARLAAAVHRAAAALAGSKISYRRQHAGSRTPK